MSENTLQSMPIRAQRTRKSAQGEQPAPAGISGRGEAPLSP